MIFEEEEEEEIKFQKPCGISSSEGGKRIEGRGGREREEGDDYNKRCVHHGPPAKINERPGRETMKTEFQWLEKSCVVAKRGYSSFLLLSLRVFRRLGRGFPRNIGSKPEQLRERARYWWKVRRSIRYATGCPGLIYGRVPAEHCVNLRVDCRMKWAKWKGCFNKAIRNVLLFAYIETGYIAFALIRETEWIRTLERLITCNWVLYTWYKLK